MWQPALLQKLDIEWELLVPSWEISLLNLSDSGKKIIKKKKNLVPKKLTDYEHSQYCYNLHASILYSHMTEHSPTVHRPVGPKMHSCLQMVKLKQNKKS